MTCRALVTARLHHGAICIPALLLLGLPLTAASGQRLEPAAATIGRQHSESLLSSEVLLARDVRAHGTRFRTFKGMAAGASSGAVTGLIAWALHTWPVAFACDLNNSATGIGGDTEPQRCNWHAHRRRAQYTWTGLILGASIGGIVGRVTLDSEPRSER